MIVKISFKHMKSSPKIREYILEKNSKLAKYFNGRVSATWSLDTERELRHAHCHITGKHMDYFGEAHTDDLIASIDIVIAKIEKQIRRHKEVVKDHLHANKTVPDPELPDLDLEVG